MNTVGLIALVNGVRAIFTANGSTAKVTTVGWKQRFEQINQGVGGAARVAFMPGDANGGGGELVRSGRGSTNPRVLLEWKMPCTVSIWAVDTTDRNSEELNITAAILLLEQTIQAMNASVDPDTGHAVGVANIEWGSVEWTTSSTEMAFGKELLVSFVHRSQIFDVTRQTTTPQPAVHRAPFTT